MVIMSIIRKSFQTRLDLVPNKKTFHTNRLPTVCVDMPTPYTYPPPSHTHPLTYPPPIYSPPTHTNPLNIPTPPLGRNLVPGIPTPAPWTDILPYSSCHRCGEGVALYMNSRYTTMLVSKGLFTPSVNSGVSVNA